MSQIGRLLPDADTMSLIDSYRPQRVNGDRRLYGDTNVRPAIRSSRLFGAIYRCL